jgi:hypothetical protein
MGNTQPVYGPDKLGAGTVFMGVKIPPNNQQAGPQAVNMIILHYVIDKPQGGGTAFFRGPSPFYYSIPFPAIPKLFITGPGQ